MALSSASRASLAADSLSSDEVVNTISGNTVAFFPPSGGAPSEAATLILCPATMMTCDLPPSWRSLSREEAGSVYSKGFYL